MTLRPRMPTGSTNPFLDGAPSKTERVREKAEKSPGLVALPNDTEFSGERKRVRCNELLDADCRRLRSKTGSP